MIFWLCVLILVVSIIMTIVANREDWFGVEMFCCTTSVLAGIAVIIMAICLCVNYSTVDADIAQREEIYKAITYKVESGACRDELGLLSKEVIDEVQEWNKDVLYYQNVQDNFWVGIFYPNIYDQFETIDYTKYAKE